MSKALTKAQAFALLLLVIHLACPFRIVAAAQTDKEKRAAKRIRMRVVKIGVGQKARVKAHLRDGTEVKGYVKEIAEDKFSVVEETSGATRDLTYLQVKSVEGGGLPTAVKAPLIFAAVGGISILLLALALKGS